MDCDQNYSKDKKKKRLRRKKRYLKHSNLNTNDDGEHIQMRGNGVRMDTKINDKIGTGDLFVPRSSSIRQEVKQKTRLLETSPGSGGEHQLEPDVTLKEEPKKEPDKSKVESVDEEEEEVFYEIPEINYAEEYEEFKHFLSAMIETSCGITVKNPRINFENFRKYLDIYGSRDLMEKNFRLHFQPNVIVQQNFCTLGDDGQTLKRPKDKSSICVVNEETFIYPNELIFASTKN